VYIHTGQAWKICLATVGIAPTTFGILAQFTWAHYNNTANIIIKYVRKKSVECKWIFSY
jgi:hypothetical protein